MPISLKSTVSAILEKIVKLTGRNNRLFSMILNGLAERELDLMQRPSLLQKVGNYLLRLIPKGASFQDPIFKSVSFRHRDFKFKVWLDVTDYTQIRYYFAYPDPALRNLLLKGGRTFVDIGSNVGIFSVLAAQTFKKVHAFEPLPSVFETLQKNSKPQGNMSVHNVALSDQSGSVTFHFNPLGSGGSSIEGVPAHHLEKTNKVARTFDVQARTLDSYLDEIQDVDFIKIDVEGHETSALRGASKTIEKFRPALFVEIHDDHRFQEIKKLLPQGYRVVDPVTMQEHPRPYPDVLFLAK
ncbi:MAG: FkbM family methyltransferase [Bdellovibrionales bacterium]|nr:FkbM family methyltransferase [Bdellovibrionales bacterium]